MVICLVHRVVFRVIHLYQAGAQKKPLTDVTLKLEWYEMGYLQKYGWAQGNHKE